MARQLRPHAPRSLRTYIKKCRKCQNLSQITFGMGGVSANATYRISANDASGRNADVPAGSAELGDPTWVRCNLSCGGGAGSQPQEFLGVLAEDFLLLLFRDVAALFEFV